MWSRLGDGVRRVHLAPHPRDRLRDRRRLAVGLAPLDHSSVLDEPDLREVRRQMGMFFDQLTCVVLERRAVNDVDAKTVIIEHLDALGSLWGIDIVAGHG